MEHLYGIQSMETLYVIIIIIIIILYNIYPALY